MARLSDIPDCLAICFYDTLLSNMALKRFIVLDKKVGETPLECMEAWRATQSSAYKDLPMTYAGRLDPMASGKLLVLIGEECKQKESYLGLDKEYEFEVLFGLSSDSGDILGIVESHDVPDFGCTEIRNVVSQLQGKIELPYPKFSSKTVNGKPLHTWTLENRLDEIDIPTKTSTIHKLELMSLETVSMENIYKAVSQKIETVTPVTEKSKALGNDFRRPEVREAWKKTQQANLNREFKIAKFKCAASSGTYMRTLAEVIAKDLNTKGLAYSIHRTKLGKYKKALPFLGFWTKKY